MSASIQNQNEKLGKLMQFQQYTESELKTMEGDIKAILGKVDSLTSSVIELKMISTEMLSEFKIRAKQIDSLQADYHCLNNKLEDIEKDIGFLNEGVGNSNKTIREVLKDISIRDVEKQNTKKTLTTAVIKDLLLFFLFGSFGLIWVIKAIISYIGK